ncbi:MAG: hypothetical protein M3N29_07520 [Chloroflexota bacterium]|nr:hypothetical protein [Chloroflexota bacterium]
MARYIRRSLAPAAVGWLLAALVAPSAAVANMAAPWTPGDAAGEPSAQLAGVVIESEDLTIDLRPLHEGHAARVHATYHLRNDEAQKTVELVFVAPGLDAGGATAPAVSLDGEAVQYEVVQSGGLPWAPPSHTPRIGGGQLDYRAHGDGELRFKLTIPNGRHAVSVEYSATAASDSTGASPTRAWQFAYVLSPAREWPGFGTLNVSVALPSGWPVASEPPLERQGDTLTGTFERIPADALAITTRAPAPPIGLLQPLAVALVLGAGLLLAWWGGRALARRGRRTLWLLPVSILYALFAPVLMIIAMQLVSGLVPQSQRAIGADYGPIFFVLLLSPLIALAVVIAMQMVAAIAGRRTAVTRRLD